MYWKITNRTMVHRIKKGEEMDENFLCKQEFYSELYADYIIETGGNIGAIQRKYAPDCISQIDSGFITLFENQQTKGMVSFEKYGYGAVPKCYGLLDVSSIESTGALRVRRRPNFSLDGSGVLVGFVDTGIDYTNDVFINADGTTRISYIWDQTVEDGTAPEGIGYGAEYGKEKINQALTSENPRDVLWVEDPTYHGTYLAAITAGKDKGDVFTGMVPNAEILMVKVKEAKGYLREFYGISKEVACYQENDIMMGVRYLWEKAAMLRKPIVICIGMGTNAGSHTGDSPLELLINRVGNLSGVCIVGAAGNETNMAHHYAGTVEGVKEQIVEVDVEQEQGMTLEIWTNSIGAISVGITSPEGEFSGRIPIRTYEQKVDFVFIPTTVSIYYDRFEYYSGQEVITFRMDRLVKGIWKLHVINLSNEEISYNIWLPIRNFVSEKTKFLQPNPDTIVCAPGNGAQIITTGAYNHRDNSIFLNSSRGFTADSRVKPDLVAPGVNVYGPVSPLRYGERSGTSVAAAHTAGAAAMLLEWGIVRQNDLEMNTRVVKRYLIYGAKRPELEVPSKSYGWGSLDVYKAFEQLRNT